MSDFRKHLNKSLEDEEFKKERDKLKLRNAYNLSQTELAKKIGTTQAVISRIENGTVNVGIDFLAKIAKAFDKKIEINIL